MGLFDGLFGKNSEDDINKEKINCRPVLTLAFEELPQIKQSQIKTDIGKLERSSIIVSIKRTGNRKSFSGYIEFRNRRINLVAVDAKISTEILDAMVKTATHWDKKYREELANIRHIFYAIMTEIIQILLSSILYFQRKYAIRH